MEDGSAAAKFPGLSDAQNRLDRSLQQGQDQDTNPICDLCSDLRLPIDQPSFREVSYEAVKSAAQQGCISCSLILSAISEFCNSLSPQHQEIYASLKNPWVEIIWRHSRLSITARFRRVDDGYITLTLELFSYAGSSTWPAIQRSADIPNKLDVSLVVEKAIAWIDNCQSTHPHCKLPQLPTLPSRIIHVGSRESYDDIRLMSGQNASGRYVALSYCWGKEQGMIRTTKSSISSWTQRIPWDRLPKTFQDAIRITRELGVPYLWIDALCILQDDMTDWELESANMANIYSNSYLTISATAASDSHAGLFLDRWTKPSGGKDTRLPVEGLPLQCMNQERMIVRHRLDLAHSRFRNLENANHHIEDAPLLTRAWAFQERLLPSHTLHFHAEELIWECKSAVQCECTELDQHHSYEQYGMGGWLKNFAVGELHKNESATYLGHVWLDLVSEFSTLRLTRETDRLPALSGLASAFCGKVLGTYIAGIWEHDIARGLLFETVQLNYDDNGDDDSPAAQIMAPSWSWASMHLSGANKISYGTVLQSGFIQDENFRFEKVFLTPNSSNPLSWVSQGLLQIRGCCTIGLITPNQESEFVIEVQGIQKGISHEYVFLDSLDEDLENVPLLCMLVGSQEDLRDSEYILVLRKKDDETNTHKRVGLLVTRRCPWSLGGEPVLTVLLA